MSLAKRTPAYSNYGLGNILPRKHSFVFEGELGFRTVSVRRPHRIELCARREFIIVYFLIRNVLRYQLEFEDSRLPDEVYSFLRVLYSGKFNQYPVAGLRPNIRLSHSELVDPVPDGLKGLAYRHSSKIVGFLQVHGEKQPRSLRRCLGGGGFQQWE